MAKKLVTLSKEANESLNAIRDIVKSKSVDKFIGQNMLQLHEVYHAITGIVPNNGCGSQCVASYVNIVYNYITYHEIRTEPVVIVATTAKVVQSPVKINDGILNAPGLEEALSELPTTKSELWKLAKSKGYQGSYQKSTEKQLTEFIQSK